MSTVHNNECCRESSNARLTTPVIGTYILSVIGAERGGRGYDVGKDIIACKNSLLGERFETSSRIGEVRGRMFVRNKP